MNDKRINFNSAVAFFEYLGFITVSADLLIPTDEGRGIYTTLDDTRFEETLCEVCLNKVMTDGIIKMESLRFDAINGRYYILKHGFPISAAVFRNILIQLHALIERSDGSLELRECYESLFAKVQKNAKRKMTLESLKDKLEQQEKQGEEAELYVLKYEMQRLASSPLIEKIKRISEIDVSAGYDIVSFEDVSSLNYDCYIEVKSFAGQPLFYWSKNEIEVAMAYGDRYYIYLVNAEKYGDSDYAPTIIQNPAEVVMKSENWLIQPTSYLVLPIERHLSTN